LLGHVQQQSILCWLNDAGYLFLNPNFFRS
jgi:hypothetical protein